MRDVRVLAGVLMIVLGLAAIPSFRASAQAPSSFHGMAPPAGSIGLLVTAREASAGNLVLELRRAGCEPVSLGVLVEGSWGLYLNGAPANVNTSFPKLLTNATPFFVRCSLAPPASGPPQSRATQPPGVPQLSIRIDFIDVGQGDATLITVNGDRLLIDGGRSQARIEERLNALGVTQIEAILSTHPDTDHVAGLVRVLALYDVDRVYLNGGASDNQTYANYLALVEASAADVMVLGRGDAIALGGLQLDVIHPAALTGEATRIRWSSCSAAGPWMCSSRAMRRSHRRSRCSQPGSCPTWTC